MARPPIYKTPEEMQERIDRYFLDCQGRPILDPESGEPMRDKQGRLIISDARPPTMTGLALALGLSGRQALLNYKGRKAFVDTVTQARARVEQYAEERLYDRDGARGAEFTLRHNFKWQEDVQARSAEGGVVILSPVAKETEEK